MFFFKFCLAGCATYLLCADKQRKTVNVTLGNKMFLKKVRLLFNMRLEKPFLLRSSFSHHEVHDTGAHLRMTYLGINAHDVIQDGAEKVHEL